MDMLMARLECLRLAREILPAQSDAVDIVKTAAILFEFLSVGSPALPACTDSKA
jgi:hypothetical protein